MRIVFSRVNNAFFIMFGDSIIRIVNTREEAQSLIDEWSGK